MHRDTSNALRQPWGMTVLQELQRACRVFLARPLIVHGEDAPDVLRPWRFTSTWTKCVGWKGRLSLLRPPGSIAAD